jgi:UDP-N-acetylglucosamine 2-epimerase (non-hydrolysing)
MVITDSGGVQEEAATLGKPVLITRHVTERIEGVLAGSAKVVGTSTEDILYECQRLINDQQYYNSMARAANPYGDGTSCEQILTILKKKIFDQSNVQMLLSE